jgi:hypothetical protein
MGGGASQLDSKYEKERSKLRRALILSFIDDEKNKDIIGQIESLKARFPLILSSLH